MSPMSWRFGFLDKAVLHHLLSCEPGIAREGKSDPIEWLARCNDMCVVAESPAEQTIDAVVESTTY